MKWIRSWFFPSYWSKPFQFKNYSVRLHISSNMMNVKVNKEDLRKLILGDRHENE